MLSIGFAIGVNYIILEGQLVLCYRFLSKQYNLKQLFKVNYQGQLSIIKVTFINSYQLLLDIKVTALWY